MRTFWGLISRCNIFLECAASSAEASFRAMRNGGGDRKGGLVFDLLGEGDAGDPLHGEKRLSVVLSEVVGAHDVRVADVPRKQDLLTESLERRFVVRIFAAKHFDGNLDVKQSVVGFVDDTGRAFTYLLEEVVATP